LFRGYHKTQFAFLFAFWLFRHLCLVGGGRHTPKLAVPPRTWFTPKPIAVSKSALIPQDVD
jgi:hypothetical protein